MRGEKDWGGREERKKGKRRKVDVRNFCVKCFSTCCPHALECQSSLPPANSDSTSGSKYNFLRETSHKPGDWASSPHDVV